MGEPMTTRAPRIAGVVPLEDGRDFGFAEFGPRDGDPLLWLHGTPGSCRQVAPDAVAAAEREGIRIIGLSRPGAGASTPARYRRIVDIVADVEQVVDRLGVDRFAVAGLSGGGPYTLAIGARMRDRCVGLAVFGGVAPSCGDDAARGGVTALTAQFQPLLRRSSRALGHTLNVALKPLIPAANQIGDAFFRLLPESDRAVFEMPGVKDMFIGDLSLSLTHGFGMHAMMRDAVLFGRDWGFRLDEVEVPVHWWHGDEDTIVPLHHGEWVVSRLPNVTFHLQPGYSHLSGYAAAEEVIEAVRSYFD